jgi:prophage regulatory protein
MVQAILRRADVERATGLSRSTIYELMAAGGFPKPVPLTPRSVGWIEADIVRWQRERIEARDKPRRRQPKGSGRRSAKSET